jgi:hypothetical protein
VSHGRSDGPDPVPPLVVKAPFVEISIDEAMTAIERGEIVDGKTIMLLQYAFIHVFE